MESQLETSQTVSALKLPVLKTREYDLWSMRMEQYLTFTDHALWEVIVNGDLVSPIKSASASVEGHIPPETAKQKLAKKNELKAKSTLMLAILDEHLLKFHACKDANSLWEAIKNSNTNETINIPHNVSAASSKDQASTLSYVNDVIFYFFANQSNAPQLDSEDLEHIDVDDLEEMDLKWQVAMLTMRVKRFIKKTGRKLDLNGKETVSFDRTKVECYNCRRRGHFAREYRAPRNHGNRNRDDPIKNAPVDTSTTNYDAQVKGISIKDLKNQLEEALKRKDDLKLKLEKFEESSKNLTKLINSQITAKDKIGLGFVEQVNESEVLDNVFDSHESDKDDNPVNDRFKKVKGNHVVLPPYIGKYMPSRPDLSFVRPKSDQTKPKFTKINFVKSGENVKSVNTVAPKSKVNDASIIRRDFNQKSAAKTNNFNEKVNIARVKNITTAASKAVVSAAKGNGENDVNGCSRHMTGNKSFLIDYQDIDGGFVAFAGRAKGGGLICLFAKATINESNLWHRRLGHINFKTMNKLVRGNLVRGLPLKLFENDQTCVACQKGKQHKASCKTKNQNGVAERKNRTLIEAARTMLVDSKLPTTFWAEAVNTACYVQNRVLVIKPHNKTPYELFLGRKPALSFMRPFGCPVTILNTLDHLGKFDGKSDDGFFVGYSINSKAFRVFNTRTKFVEENLHINFLENKSNVAGTGPNWMFDIDTLTMSMNYQPVFAGNQTNGNAGTKANIDEGQGGMKTVPGPQYVLLPFLTSDSQSPKSSEDEVADDAGKKNGVLDPAKEGDKSGQGKATNTSSTNKLNIVSSSIDTVSFSFTTMDPGRERAQRNEFESVFGQDKDVNGNSIYRMFTLVNTAGSSCDNLDGSISVNAATLPNPDLPTDPLMPEDTTHLLNTSIFSCSYDDEDVEGIDYDEVFAPVARIEAIRLFLAYASFMGFIVYQMDVKSAFLYGTIEEEVYVCQPPGFEDPQFPDKVYKVYVDDIIFGFTKKSLCVEFEQMMHKRFQMSSMGEITFFLGLQVKQKDDGIFISQDKYVTDILKKFDFITIKTTSALIETNKALLKDEEAKDVDVHLYRSMIRSLMYLTASRPDIMFAICACARFQVTPKVSHLHVVKRIFRYLRGQPKLGLWYPRDSPFDLEACSDSDYAGASLDRKSTIEGVVDLKSDA
ncbi:putative ribonuclease H-like domain-containing protein [Tanacetum coccineum]